MINSGSESGEMTGGNTAVEEILMIVHEKGEVDVVENRSEEGRIHFLDVHLVIWLVYKWMRGKFVSHILF